MVPKAWVEDEENEDEKKSSLHVLYTVHSESISLNWQI